jgi:NADPH-dependent curcumin reductase CurA
MSQIARTIELFARPEGAPKPSDFRMTEVQLPDVRPGEVLLGKRWLSPDPCMRSLMPDDRAFAAKTAIGQPLPCEAVAEVLVSQADSLVPGDHVLVYDYWRDHAVRSAADCRKLDPTMAGQNFGKTLVYLG